MGQNNSKSSNTANHNSMAYYNGRENGGHAKLAINGNSGSFRRANKADKKGARSSDKRTPKNVKGVKHESETKTLLQQPVEASTYECIPADNHTRVTTGNSNGNSNGQTATRKDFRSSHADIKYRNIMKESESETEDPDRHGDKNHGNKFNNPQTSNKNGGLRLERVEHSTDIKTVDKAIASYLNGKSNGSHSNGLGNGKMSDKQKGLSFVRNTEHVPDMDYDNYVVRSRNQTSQGLSGSGQDTGQITNVQCSTAGQSGNGQNGSANWTGRNGTELYRDGSNGNANSAMQPNSISLNDGVNVNDIDNMGNGMSVGSVNLPVNTNAAGQRHSYSGNTNQVVHDLDYTEYYHAGRGSTQKVPELKGSTTAGMNGRGCNGSRENHNGSGPSRSTGQNGDHSSIRVKNETDSEFGFDRMAPSQNGGFDRRYFDRTRQRHSFQGTSAGRYKSYDQVGHGGNDRVVWTGQKMRHFSAGNMRHRNKQEGDNKQESHKDYETVYNVRTGTKHSGLPPSHSSLPPPYGSVAQNTERVQGKTSASDPRIRVKNDANAGGKKDLKKVDAKRHVTKRNTHLSSKDLPIVDSAIMSDSTQSSDNNGSVETVVDVSLANGRNSSSNTGSRDSIDLSPDYNSNGAADSETVSLPELGGRNSETGAYDNNVYETHEAAKQHCADGRSATSDALVGHATGNHGFDIRNGYPEAQNGRSVENGEAGHNNYDSSVRHMSARNGGHGDLYSSSYTEGRNYGDDSRMRNSYSEVYHARNGQNGEARGSYCEGSVGGGSSGSSGVDQSRYAMEIANQHHINNIMLQETERSKEAFMDMLAARYPKYAEKISSTTSEDGFPVRGRSRDPRRRATVGYSQHNRSMDYEGSLSEVDGPASFHRGGFIRSSLPAARSPPLDKPPGLVFLIFRDETKKALLPNEITHLDTVRAMFVRSFPGKLTMSFLESPKRKIYILEHRTNIYYQLEDLRDIKDRTVLRVHECDSKEPQRVLEKPEVRGRTIQVPGTPSAAQGFYGTLPSSAVTSQVHKTQTLPAYMHHPVYMSHDDISQSPSRTAYERSRSLTPDPVRATTPNYAQNPIYGRMGISPERPMAIPPQERHVPTDRPLGLRTIPENYLMLNGYKNGLVYNYGDPQGPHRPHPRQAMSPPAVPSGPRIDPGRRAFSPPPNLQNYEYVQVVPGSHGLVPLSQAGAPSPVYMAKGVRASTVVTPLRSSGGVPQTVSMVTAAAPSQPGTPGAVPHGPQGTPTMPGHQHTWRERSPVGRHSLALSTVQAQPYSTPSNVQQRSQSYRVQPTTERDPALLRPRSMTPSPMDNFEVDFTRNRIDKMENQLANLAAWVQSAVIHSGSSGEPSGGKSGTGTPSQTSAEPSPQGHMTGHMVHPGPGLLQEVGMASPVALSHDMKMNILSIKHQADALRHDLHSLRRLQQINKESILETVDDAWKKIREALSSIPGAENLIIRQQRNEVDVMYKIYLEDKAQADKELSDLEHAVEELRSDVLSRQCRVQMSDVEGMALVLSHVTKQLGELKVRFPKLQENLKLVMSSEMEVIVVEERFLKEEPERLDNSLKKCKKLTGTLFTLKRLASVQEHRPPQTVAISAQARIPTLEDKKAVLQNIQAMIPDHEARLQGIQAAETARQIKKKITNQQESLRFGKSLELATKALKPQGVPAPSSMPGETATAGYHASLPTQGSMGPPQQTSGHGHHGYGHSGPSPSSTATDTSSVISFVMPMSTSTPKSATQPPPTSSKYDSSATSPSMSYPVMSLMREMDRQGRGSGRDPHSEQYIGHSQSSGARNVKHVKVQDPRGHQRDYAGSSSEPAILPVTSSETSGGRGQRRAGDRAGESRKSIEQQAYEKSKNIDLNSQKTAARAAFFSSLSSPSTPTSVTSPISSTGTMLLVDSPTEGSTKISPSSGSSSSPIRGIPTLVRSSAVSMPCSSVSTAVTRPPQAAASLSAAGSLVTKPSSLPVSGSSVVSSQRFSPASPSSAAVQTTSSRPRTTFTAIPKPYSPTKSTPSPLTPESPKYRIPPSQQASLTSSTVSVHVSDNRRRPGAIPQQQTISKDSIMRPKKVPPPPPPRKSSRLPGHAVLAVNTATVNGQLPKPKHSEPQISKPSVTFDTSTKLSTTDIIRPPKQFANLELEAKVERKSSVGSLKQFTTPLLESKRDKTETKDQSHTEVVGKKVSASNLDTQDKSVKEITKKDLEDLSMKSEQGETTQHESSRKIIDGKVTNISDTDSSSRRTSTESTGSSASSVESQSEIWLKQKHGESESASYGTQISKEPTDQSQSSSSKSDQSDSGTGTSSKHSDQSETAKQKSDQSSGSQSEQPVATSSASSKPIPEERSGSMKKKKGPAPPERRSSLSSKPKTEEIPDSERERERHDTKQSQSKGSIDRLV